MISIKEKSNVFLELDEEYDRINIKGDLSSNKAVVANRVKVKGNVLVDNDIRCAELIDIKGELRARNVSSSEFSIHGNANLERLTARKIKVVSSRNSNIGTIQADEIVIKSGTNAELNDRLINSLLDTFKVDVHNSGNVNDSHFKIGSIHGKIVELHSIIVNEIIEDKVTLNGSCVINKVVYLDELEIKGDSKVLDQHRAGVE